MIRRAAALVAALAAGVIGLGWMGALGLALPDSPAGADSASNCATGVIVAADFSHWGGHINTVCDSHRPLPTNAAEALVAARFDPRGVRAYGLAFICQIAGDPPNDSCATTPPADAYWSFWIAGSGGDTWTYSPLGAENTVPHAGSVEAWIFGANTGARPPSDFPSPNTIRASFSSSSATTTTTTQAPRTTTTPSVESRPSGQKKPTSAAKVAPSPGTSENTTGAGHLPLTSPRPEEPQRNPTRRLTSTGPKTSTTTAGRASTGKPASDQGAPNRAEPTSPAPGIVDAAPAPSPGPPAGSPLPFVIGSVAILLLGGTAGFVAWRRHRNDGA